MIFKVKNLGYIEEAEVDLSKDLIVFTGHNNTGKTYLAYAIYFLNKSFSDHISFKRIEVILGNEVSQSTRRKLKLNNKETTINLTTSKILNIISQKTTDEIIFKVLDEIKDNFENLFSTSMHFPNIDISIDFDKPMMKNLLTNKKFNFHKIGKQYTSDSHDGYTLLKKTEFQKNISMSFKIEIYDNDDFGDEDREEIKNDLYRSLLVDIYEPVLDSFWNKSTYIAPAERNAINIFSKELSLAKNRVLKNKNGASKDIEFLNRYPLPIQDNLEIAEDLAHLSRNKSDFAYLAEELEQDFLKGTISTNQYGQIEYTPDNTEKVNLEIHLAASMVKSLSNIVFYLRHLAQKGDCIIIDEPELNLHPDNQRKIARFIGRLVNEGFQVVISTHSDYIIKELNNMIMLSKAKGERDDLIKNLGFRGDELLKPEQVEAQLFTLNSRKPEKIPITDEGFEVSTINEVIEQQDNDLEKIYYELFQKVM